MKKWVNVFCLLGILFFLGLHFRPEYLLNTNVIAGGDTPSHYGLAHHILESKSFFGWMPGNFSGFAAFQFYPPFSFFLILTAAKILPLPIAFKLVMVLGTFLFPLAVFYCLMKLGFSFPTPILGAIFSLIFLFNEGNSMWGANIPSTLAGEFSYSLGFAFSLAFLGILYNHLSSGKGVRWLALFLAVIGLTHGYPFIFCLMVSSFFLIIARDPLRMISRLARLYTFTFLLMGFWLIPALFSISLTIPFNFVWRFESIKEFIPPLYFPLVAIILVSHIYLFLSKKMHLRIVFLWYAALMSFIGYLFSFSFGLVDIRFLPFAQGIFVLLAAVGIGECLKGFKAIELIPLAAVLLVFAGVSCQANLIPHWISYDFSGLEEKPLWNEYKETNQYLRGSVADPRVVYEHSPEHEAAGTVRAFEILPMFSGRSTLEGLYMQSSINSPFAYYIQSEISQAGSHPFMHYNYPRFDLQKAAGHLELFNVSQFITISEATQRAASDMPALELEKEISPYKIFRLKKNEGKYVVPLEYKPLFVKTDDWKRLFFDWFRLSNNDVFLILPGKQRLPDGYSLINSSILDLNMLPAVPLNKEVEVKEKVSSDEIIIETTQLTHPLLIKVSYHPNWHVQGAEAVYLTSPGFMVVFPHSHRIRLYYAPGSINHIGWAGSILGLVLLCLPLSFVSGKEKPGSIMNFKYRWIVFLGLIALAIGLGFHIHYDAHVLHQKGLKFFHEKKYDKAQALFSKGIERFPFSPAVDESCLYNGLCYYMNEQFNEALSVWNEYLDKYPEGRTVAEILYHIGLSYEALGQEQKAKAIFEELKSKFPNSRFSALVQ